MLGLRSSEAAGVPLLGQFLARVACLLSELSTSAEFKSVMEFNVVNVPSAGKNPSTDAIHQVLSPHG